jgi:hypothetical protein
MNCLEINDRLLIILSNYKRKIQIGELLLVVVLTPSACWGLLGVQACSSRFRSPFGATGGASQPH